MSLGMRLIRWGLANALLAGISFLCAGSVRSHGLTAYLVVFAAVGLVTSVAISSELAKERSEPVIEGIDAGVRLLASGLFVATVGLGAFDAGRLHWPCPFSRGVQIAGLGIFLAAHALQSWAMVVNAFFSTALRLQTERGHRLVSRGPYRFVRHPGYLAMLLMMPAAALALGSTPALVPASIYGALILYRTTREDRFPVDNLPGYAGYACGVRYRLIPGLW